MLRNLSPQIILTAPSFSYLHATINLKHFQSRLPLRIVSSVRWHLSKPKNISQCALLTHEQQLQIVTIYTLFSRRRLNRLSRHSLYGECPSTEPDVRLSRIRLLTRLIINSPLCAYGILLRITFPLFFRHCVRQWFICRILPCATAFPLTALPASFGTMQLSDCLYGFIFLR